MEQAESPEQLLGPSTRFANLAPLGRGLQNCAQQAFATQPQADHDIIKHAHLWKDARCLEGTADAEGGDTMRRRVLDRPATEMDVAGVCSENAGDNVEYGRFAGAIRPNQAGDAPRRYVEGHLIDCSQAAETVANAG